MKFAIKVTEYLVRTVIVDADTYDQAEEKLEKAYARGGIQLNADNSAVDVEFQDDTEQYKDIFTEQEIADMKVEVK